MAATLSYPIRALKRENILCWGRIEIGADADPDSVNGVIASCSTPASGVYTVTMNTFFPYATIPWVTIEMNTPIAVYPVVDTWTPTTGVLLLLLAGADLVSAATVNQAISVDVHFFGFNQQN